MDLDNNNNNFEKNNGDEFNRINKDNFEVNSNNENTKDVFETNAMNEVYKNDKDAFETGTMNELYKNNKEDFTKNQKTKLENSSKKTNTSSKKHSKEDEKNAKAIAAAKDIFEWIYCIVIAVVVAVLIKYYLGTPTVVKQSSMYPTLEETDRLILSRINRDKCPERGDIITFEAPVAREKGDKIDMTNPIAKYTYEPQGWWNRFVYYVLEFGKTSYIKRVIGLPGEHVLIKDGKVYIDDKELEEKYLEPGLETPVTGSYFDLIVPENSIFVMGDNRPDSTDSRIFGCIPFDKIEGRVVLRFFPFNKFGNIEKINSIQKEKWDAMENE